MTTSIPQGEHGLHILGTGIYLPEKEVTNEALCQLVDSSDEWIVSRTGIRSRHVSTGEFTWEMGLSAARNALQAASLSGDEVQAVIGVTCSPDFYYPSLSCIIASKIGANHPLTVDINCACTGFIYALDMAQRYLRDSDISRVLIVSSEILSKQTDFSDRSSCILFGDGAAAVVVERGPGRFGTCLRSEGSKTDVLLARTHPVANPWSSPRTDDPFHPTEGSFLYMDGSEVYKFAVHAMPEAMTAVCEKMQIPVQQLDFLIPHQANLRIIQTAAKTLNFPMEKICQTIATTGNTSSASIPICLHQAMAEGRIQTGQTIGLVGFGAGLTYGACVWEL